MQDIRISLIVAVAENGVIGAGNQLLWHLPADMKHFKTLTTGHCIIMGRKTYESIGRPLPNRMNIIITRSPNFKAEGCFVVYSLEEAIRCAGGMERGAVTMKQGMNDIDSGSESFQLFIIGGGEIYRQALPLVHTIYLTEVKHSFVGDTCFPDLNATEWQEISRISHPADEKNLYAYDFVELSRMPR